MHLTLFFQVSKIFIEFKYLLLSIFERLSIIFMIVFVGTIEGKNSEERRNEMMDFVF
jgi:hypothetical protein